MDALATQIRGYMADTTDVAVQVEGRMILSPTPPSIDIYPADTARDPDSASFADLNGGYLLTVRARVNTADAVAGQNLLLAFMDDADNLCLAEAIEEDQTLDHYAASVSVQAQTGFVVFPEPSGEGAWLGAQWTTLVIPAFT